MPTCEQLKHAHDSDPDLDHKQYGPNIYCGYETLGDGVAKTMLPELLFKKYGECTLHYTGTNDAFFRNNPFVTKYMNYDNVDLTLPFSYCFGSGNATNCYEKWCHLYGFDVDSLPKIYRPLRTENLVLLHNKPGKSWGLNREQTEELIRGLRVFGNVRQINPMLAPRAPTFLDSVEIEPMSSIEDLINLISRVLFLVCSDSGPMHIAIALGVPTMVLSPNYHISLFSLGKHNVKSPILPYPLFLDVADRTASEFWTQKTRWRFMTRPREKECTCDASEYSTEVVLKALNGLKTGITFGETHER